MSTQVSFRETGAELFRSYLTCSGAAVAATIPVFYGFIAKSALQAGVPMPRLTLFQLLKSGTTAGLIMGAQCTVQDEIEKICQPRLTQYGKGIATVSSASIVGAISAPFLAVFNGKTMGYSVTEALKKLSLKQAGAITVRETFFLSALSLSGPVSEKMRKRYGDYQLITLVSSFGIGVIGSILGHVPDAMLTRLQKGLSITHISQLTRGLATRAVTVGGFTALYPFFKGKIEKNMAPSFT